MTLQDFLQKNQLKDYILTVQNSTTTSDVTLHHIWGKSFYYLEFGSSGFAFLPLDQTIMVAAEGILVRDEDNELIQIRVYRRELVKLDIN